jgi:rubrerythrin
MTTIDSRARHARIAARWQQRPDSDLATIEREVDAELEAEQAEAAEADARAREFSESLTAMAYTCAVCGQTRDPRAADALCPACRRVVWQVRAERAAAEQVSDSTRRALAEQYVDSRG